MAISRIAPPGSPPATPESDLSLLINNGDVVALRSVTKRLGFRDEESVLRYALAVLSRSATSSLTITEKNGQSISLIPSADLLKAPDAPPQS